jgi:molybdopterin-containing oxidoreductase family iron-sulfur binding subunit
MNEVQKSDQADAQRRRFLGGAGIAALMLAPGVRIVDLVRAKPADEAVTGRVRWGMLVDATKCAQGCTECVDACNAEQGLNKLGRPEIEAQYIRKLDLKDKATGYAYSLPMLCQHCETAPCVDVCPTGASFRRADGIVLVDRHICIGCRYCMMACPYKARSLVHEPLQDQNPDVPRGQGCVESCTLCVHRIDRGQLPACVEACKEGAMIFGDLKDPNSEIARRLATEASKQIRADLNLNTGVRYQGI